jgi:hypothetical protein
VVVGGVDGYGDALMIGLRDPEGSEERMLVL